MADPRLVYSAVIGEYEAAVKELEKPIREAGIAAVKEAGAIVRKEAVSAIAGAGLSNRWQTGFKSRIYTDQVKNPGQIASAFFYHRIGLFNVFEKGAQIKGEPLLWLPLPTLPAAFRRLGGRRLTPEKYVETIGPLVSINVPGKRPMLVGRADRGRRGKGKITTGALRRGGKGIGNVKSVPLFIGVSDVSIGKRLNIEQIVDRVNDMLPELYLKHVKDT